MSAAILASLCQISSKPPTLSTHTIAAAIAIAMVAIAAAAASGTWVLPCLDIRFKPPCGRVVLWPSAPLLVAGTAGDIVLLLLVVVGLVVFGGFDVSYSCP